MNEALPYVEAVHEMYKGEDTGVGHVPSWMVIDQRYRNRYVFAGLMPRQPFPGRWFKEGVIKKAASIEELAAEIDVPADALKATVDKFNGFARSGTDEDFHRGESAYDKYYSDPTVKPNPSLNVIDQGPFYAVKIVPGDLGTKGGLVTDERARVLRPDGSVIPGLYAAGNVSSRRHGPHLRRPRCDHRSRPGVRLPGCRGHRRHRRGARGGDCLMPIDPSVAIGADLGSRSFSWSSSDVLLYHLGIGAGARPGDNLDPSVLRWTTEHAATAASRCCRRSASSRRPSTRPRRPRSTMPGVQINLAQVVHGSQSVTVHAPIPTSGSATQRTTLTDIWDKGKAAVIWQDATVTADDGTDLWTTRSSIFVRGEGGFGGDRGTSEPVVLPDREPDADVTYTITPQQALLYRLCGDRNPLHSDPEFAKAAGFPAPILHGLCSYGITLRELTTALLDGDAAQVGGFAVKFAGVVFPGETIRVRGWREDGRIVGSATVAASDGQSGERDGAAVLGDVVLTLA